MPGTKTGTDLQPPMAAKRRAKTLVDFLTRAAGGQVPSDLGDRFYDVGLALRELGQDRLFATLGYRTLRGLLEANRLMSREDAVRLMMIVDHVSRKRAMSLGYEAALEAAAALQRKKRDASRAADTRPTDPPPPPARRDKDAPAPKRSSAAEKRAAVDAATLAAALGRRFRRIGVKGTIGEAHVREGMGWVVRVVFPLDSARVLAKKLDL